ncbi:hypothetical protein ACTFIZ_001949 [Dictyostelium cf. discoideum]
MAKLGIMIQNSADDLTSHSILIMFLPESVTKLEMGLYDNTNWNTNGSSSSNSSISSSSSSSIIIKCNFEASSSADGGKTSTADPHSLSTTSNQKRRNRFTSISLKSSIVI